MEGGEETQKAGLLMAIIRENRGRYVLVMHILGP